MAQVRDEEVAWRIHHFADLVANLDWSAEEAANSTRTIYRIANALGENAVARYRRRAAWHRVGSLGLRGGAVLSGAIGLLLPLLAGAGVRAEDSPSLAAWGFILLACAVLAWSADRLLGITASWVRTTEARNGLEQALTRFRLEWAQSLSTLDGGVPHSEQVTPLIERAWGLVEELHGLVARETVLWAKGLRLPGSNDEGGPSSRK